VLKRYFINISFDGATYSGWQIQKNSSNTIQQKINEGLSKLLGEKIEVHGCCRTDAGVHAKELYAHFDSVNDGLSVQGKTSVNWLHKFNAVLPKTISINQILSVKESANARFDATARTYKYYIHNNPNPFLNDRSYYFYSEMDVALMNKACVVLKKNKDFTAFSKLNTQTKTNICKIALAKWEKINDGLVFTIRADRFLRGMVRMIVGTMIQVGKHKLSLVELKKILDSKDCRNAGTSVPAYGLYLNKVEYPRKIFKK